MYGITAKYIIIYRNVAKILPNNKKLQKKKNITHVLKVGENIHAYKKKLVTKNGSFIYINVLVKRMDDVRCSK